MSQDKQVLPGGAEATARSSGRAVWPLQMLWDCRGKMLQPKGLEAAELFQQRLLREEGWVRGLIGAFALNGVFPVFSAVCV